MLLIKTTMRIVALGARYGVPSILGVLGHSRQERYLERMDQAYISSKCCC